MKINEITLYFNENQIDLPIGKMTFLDELYVDIQWKKETDLQQLRIEIHPKKSIILKDLAIKLDYNFNVIDEVFCNGFHSGVESSCYKVNEKVKPINKFSWIFTKHSGDQYFSRLLKNKPFYSWTYGYIKNGKILNFIGSLNEKTAFTFLIYDVKNNTINLHKECSNIQLNHSFPILDLILLEGNENFVFDRYFELTECSQPSSPPLLGLTSKHIVNYSSANFIEKNIAVLTENERKANMILIDDGYQTAVGDWLSIQPKFPIELHTITNKIKQYNYKSGMWIAPFICSKKSTIFKNKKIWLVKNKNGRPQKAGYNPSWGGWFYSLDFYNKEVQDYLLKVIHTMIHQWGFDFIKMDFLYAVCILPKFNKTRAQIMNDAMQFLRRQTEGKWLSAGNVPLGSAYGIVDYFGIGTGIHTKREKYFFKLSTTRKQELIRSSLRSTIGLWQLNGRAFNNDPGIFSIANKKSKFSINQQHTILLINTLLGNVLFCSDFVNDYNDEQWGEWDSIYYWKNSSIHTIDQYSKDVYFIRFAKEDQKYIALCNLNGSIANIKVTSRTISLEPFESMVLKN